MTKHGSNLAASALIFSSIYCRKFGRSMFFIDRRWHATCHTFRCLVGGMLAQICGVQNCGHGLYASSWPMQRACSLTLAVQRTSCAVGDLMRAVAGCGVPAAAPTLIAVPVRCPGYLLSLLPSSPWPPSKPNPIIWIGGPRASRSDSNGSTVSGRAPSYRTTIGQL